MTSLKGESKNTADQGEAQKATRECLLAFAYCLVQQMY